MTLPAGTPSPPDRERGAPDLPGDETHDGWRPILPRKVGSPAPAQTNTPEELEQNRRALARLPPAAVDYHPTFLLPAEADVLLALLTPQVSFAGADENRVRIHGRWIEIPRRQTAYGDDGTAYRFSGAIVRARPWSAAPALLALRDRVATYLRPQREPPNFALLNLYRNGRDYIGPHADDERDLEIEPDIFSVSLGAKRDFHLLPKRGRHALEPATASPKVVLSLGHGSLLVLRHPTNRRMKHTLPKRSRVTLPRLNVTFRRIVRLSAP
jgi:alkylated DNA repair dioxygenase AlkB